MVKKDFRFRPRERGESRDNVGVILPERVKKGVLRLRAIGIAEVLREPWPLALPGLQAAHRGAWSGIVERGEVIADRDHDMANAQNVLVAEVAPPPSREPDIKRFDHRGPGDGRLEI